MQVLMVEDDDVVCRLVRAGLEAEGITVAAVTSVAAAREAIRATSFDVVTLDLALPDGSGLDVLDSLRESGSSAHVIFLSGAGSEADRVRALELGADDYVVKPFFVRELTARVLAVERRRDHGKDTVLRFRDLEVDLTARVVVVDGTPVELTAKEFDLLAYLAARPGHAFSRDELLRAVWNSAAEWQQAATVTEHVRRLRQKIERDPQRPTILTTMRGVGYRFDAPTDCRAPDAGGAADAPAPATIIHIDGTIVHADAAALSMLGLAGEHELVGTSLFDLVASSSLDAARSRMAVTDAGHALQSEIMTIRRADGTELAVELVSSTVDWKGQRAGRIVATLDGDPSAGLRHLATGVLSELSDAVIVTDLAGHVRSWNGAAERLYGWSEREAIGRNVVDVIPWADDDRSTAAAAAAAAATLDVTGRWYGEGVQIGRDGAPIAVNATMTIVRDDRADAVGIVSVNRPAVTASPAPNLLDRSEIRGAIDAGQLAVHYQPIVELETGTMVAVEALLRWKHPERGLLLPGAFITVAESSGLILELGQIVLDEACAQAARWRADGIDLELSVNLSTRELEDPHLVDRIVATLASTGFDPGALWLEVTETALVVDLDQAAAILERLAALGIRIAIDDFGTGWASLTYLREFPVHALKIDRTFVEGIDHNPHDAAIARSIVALAHELGMGVVAEGVETRAQHEAVRALGCATGQGFLYGRPAPASDIGIDRARRLDRH